MMGSWAGVVVDGGVVVVCRELGSYQIQDV